MSMLEKAKKLARHTEKLAAGPDWGVDDQDILEWLISRAALADTLESASQTSGQTDAKCCEHDWKYMGECHRYMCKRCGHESTA